MMRTIDGNRKDTLKSSLIIHLLFTVLIVSSHQTSAAEEALPWQPIAGDHYHKITLVKPVSPLPQEPSIAFYFWPGSASCYQLELALQQWQKQHPQHKIHRIPLVKRPTWRLLAKAWLVAENMGFASFFLDKIYQSIHRQRITVDTLEQLEQFISTLNIDQTTFWLRFSSLAINQQLKEQQKQSHLFTISGVPTIIVNNQWISDASMATTSAQLIQVINTLLLSDQLDDAISQEPESIQQEP